MAITDQRASGIRSGGIPGIIDGSMTVSPEPEGGGLSLRIVIGMPGRNAAECDLLELIIRPEHIAHLGQALADYGTQRTDATQPFPCHIGFCSSSVSTAA